MSIRDIENAKLLKREGERLGRDGLSQRIDNLVLDFAKKYPEGNYREGIMLAGRLHAIYLATDKNDYWREVADRGFMAEMSELHRFIKPEEPKKCQ
jgi:hypothetical protein